MEITQYMETHGHEQLCAFTNKGVGLKAFIAIHDTTLGPSLGGLRIWPYQDEDAAIPVSYTHLTLPTKRIV